MKPTLTEAEAKTKWCQESFGVPEVRDGNGNGIREGGPWVCMASECMAWRWMPAFQHRDGTTTQEATGYCGKAGTP